MIDLRDEDLREALAESSYMRQRVEEVVLDREHDLDPQVEYHCLAWECLSDAVQRPYRTAVAEVCDQLLHAGVMDEG